MNDLPVTREGLGLYISYATKRVKELKSDLAKLEKNIVEAEEIYKFLPKEKGLFVEPENNV